MPKHSKTKPTFSPDYPSLARSFLEASGDSVRSKLPAGLYIIATPIGHLGDITLRALVTLSNVDLVACEDTRVSGGLLSKYGIKKQLIPYHDHNTESAGASILQTIAAGQAVALVSDAGMPLISDPGYDLVNACRAEGYDVTVIPGASAVINALAGSGLPTDQFHFAGFLPAKMVARQKALAAFKDVPGTLVFYEAPQRLSETLQDMEKILGAERPAVIARELTKLFEENRSAKLSKLAQHYAINEVKGEIVILVGPDTETTSTETFDLDALLIAALRTESLRDAVAAVTDMTGVKKSEVYARALQLTKKT
jgi:16S rRNA (cytidine1402-2'-O)-methyltransferase